MLLNYFLLEGAYKEITHTKKVDVGDWILIKKRKRSDKTIIYLGEVTNYTKSNSVDLRVLPDDIYMVDTKGNLSQPPLQGGTIRDKVSADHTRAYQWQSKWRIFRESDRPHLTETILYYVFVNLR